MAGYTQTYNRCNIMASLKKDKGIVFSFRLLHVVSDTELLQMMVRINLSFFTY